MAEFIKRIVLFLILGWVILALPALGQRKPYTLKVKLDWRADTSTFPEIKPVVDIFINYLQSHPDSIYDNPYWNKAEKEKYHFGDFDLTRRGLFNQPLCKAEELFKAYKPIIMSVNKVGEKYEIRCIFTTDSLAEEINIRPLDIIKIYATKENGEWKLENALPNLTWNWPHYQMGYINFHCPPDHIFNKMLAERSARFCDSIIRIFKFPEPTGFDYYITNSPDEMGLLEGFDYFNTSYATGNGWQDVKLLFSSNGKEWYPHEYVHMLVPKNQNRGILNEGIATLIGGSVGKTFDELIAPFSKWYFQQKNINLDSIFQKYAGWRYSSVYVSSALICKIIIDLKGYDGLKSLLMEDTHSHEKLYEALEKMTGMKKSAFQKFWEANLKTYLNEK